MGVLANNQGPLSSDTAIVPLNELSVLTNIMMELRIISILLRQGFNITDEDAALRNSMTVSDLTNLG